MTGRKPGRAQTVDQRCFYRQSEVADMFGVQDATVARWCADGVLPPLIPMGRLRFIRRDTVDRLLGKEGVA